MAGVNKVILLGNLGADPEIRHLESGSKVANISVATSESYVKNGERFEQTEWHRVELWDKLADLCERYLAKGRTVYIEGKIRTSTYQDKDGVTRYDKRIRATNLTFVGGRNDDNTDSEADTQAQQTSGPVRRSGGSPSGQSADKNHAAQPQSSPERLGGIPSEPDIDDLPF